MANTYVLVHGAWLGGWCWDKVVSYLEAAGHKAIAVDLPGHGKNDQPIIEQNMETYTQHVVDVIKAQDEPVILVAHSMGGMSSSQAAARVPEKVKKIVYVTAFLPKDGQSNDGLEDGIKPTDWKAMAAQGIAVTFDDSGTITEMLPDAAMALLYNDVPENEAKGYIAQLGKETINAQYQPVHLNEAFDALPKVYVRCSIDTIMLPEMQDNMIAATPCEAVYTIESGHSPYHAKPKELADILCEL